MNQTIHCSFIFSLEGGLDGFPLRVSNHNLPILYSAILRNGKGCPLLCASDKHRFIVRVLRARTHLAAPYSIV